MPQAIILSRGKELIISNIPRPGIRRPDKIHDGDGQGLTLQELEAKHIRAVLARTRGRINGQGGAAELLGMNSGTLRHRMRKLGIPFGRKAAHS